MVETLKSTSIIYKRTLSIRASIGHNWDFQDFCASGFEVVVDLV